MRVGPLRNLLTLQSYTTTQNAVGSIVKFWQNYATAWGSISPASSNNYEAGEKENIEITNNIRVRYNGTISPHDRITHGSSTFEIIEVVNFDKRQKYQLIKAKEIFPTTEATSIDYAGHSSEICSKAETETSPYLFLDIDEWLLYERNDTTYTTSINCASTYFNALKSVGSDVKNTTITTNIPADVSWDNEDILLVQVPKDVVLKSITGKVTGAGTVTFNLEERDEDNPSVNGVKVLEDDLVATRAGITSTLFSNASISQNNYIAFTTGTSAETGVSNNLTITIRYY